MQVRNLSFLSPSEQLEASAAGEAQPGDTLHPAQSALPDGGNLSSCVLRGSNIMTTPENVYYGDYLKIDELLSLQQPMSNSTGQPAHDEMLFIVTHQAYELWFKQILFELNAVIETFRQKTVHDQELGRVIARLNRIRAIEEVLVHQISIIETMTPLDFLEFRDILVPASGFQSIQFKQIEIRLGLQSDQRTQTDRDFFKTRLNAQDRERLEAEEREPGLFQLIEAWLERMPFLQFGEFNFWDEYTVAVERMLERDRAIVENNSTLSEKEIAFQLKNLEATRTSFHTILDEEMFASQDELKLNHRALQAALFINLYRDEPIVQLPFRVLTACVEIDELLTVWRQRHAIMVERLLGRKIGTGGSSGHDYLRRTAEQNRVFMDLFNLSTFLIPRSELPTLPSDLRKQLGFYFGGKQD